MFTIAWLMLVCGYWCVRAAVRNFQGVCVCMTWRQCWGLTAILTVQWVFLTFIYPGKGFAEHTFSFFSSNTLLSHSALIHTFTVGSCPVQEQMQVWCIFSTTCFVQGPFSFTLKTPRANPKHHLGFSLQKNPPNVFEYAFSVDFCVCKLGAFHEWSWKRQLCQIGRSFFLSLTFWLASMLKAQNLSALNLTGGILFLEQHKLVWEQGSENDFLKIIDLTPLGNLSLSECVKERERQKQSVKWGGCL